MRYVHTEFLHERLSICLLILHQLDDDAWEKSINDEVWELLSHANTHKLGDWGVRCLDYAAVLGMSEGSSMGKDSGLAYGAELR